MCTNTWACLVPQKLRLSKSKFFCAVKKLCSQNLHRNKTNKKHEKFIKKKKKVCQIVTNTLKLVPVFFSCFTFFSPKFAQILKYFAQSCDCMIAAFRNSAKPRSKNLQVKCSVYMGKGVLAQGRSYLALWIITNNLDAEMCGHYKLFRSTEGMVITE